MNNQPLEFKRLGSSALDITWSDGTKHQISSQVLRQHCPCAGCREARGDDSHAKPLTTTKSEKPSTLKIVQSSLDEETRLDQIWAVGGYALGMSWGDGHATGIYTYSFLRELGESANSLKP